MCPTAHWPLGAAAQKGAKAMSCSSYCVSWDPRKSKTRTWMKVWLCEDMKKAITQSLCDATTQGLCDATTQGLLDAETGKVESHYTEVIWCWDWKSGRGWWRRWTCGEMGTPLNFHFFSQMCVISTSDDKVFKKVIMQNKCFWMPHLCETGQWSSIYGKLAT